jgi:hypothetical protein
MTMSLKKIWSACQADSPSANHRFEFQKAVSFSIYTHNQALTVVAMRNGGDSSGCGQGKASGESWAGSGANANIVVQVPNRRLARARIEQQVIRFSVPVKIGRSR